MDDEQKVKTLQKFSGEHSLNNGTVTSFGEEKDGYGRPLMCSHVYYPLTKCNELSAPAKGYMSFAHKNAQTDEYRCMKTEHQSALKLG